MNHAAIAWSAVGSTPLAVSILASQPLNHDLLSKVLALSFLVASLSVLYSGMVDDEGDQ